MMSLIIIVLVANIVFVFSSFLSSVFGGVSEKHYFLGTGNALFSFQIRSVRFSVGWWFPVAINLKNFGGLPFTQVHAIVNEKRQRARQTWEFSDKSILRRLLVTIAPSIILLLCGVGFSIGLAYTTEETFLSKEFVNERGIYPSPWGRELGFNRGDKIVAVNGKDFENFEAILERAVNTPGTHFTVQRGDEKIDILITGSSDQLRTRLEYFIFPDVSFEVSFVRSESPASIAGIEPGDKIIRANGDSIFNFSELSYKMKSDDDGAIDLVIQRQSHGIEEHLQKRVVLGNDRLMGIAATFDLEFTSKRRTIGEAIETGLVHAFSQIVSNVKIIKGQIATEKRLSGPIAIAPVYSPFDQFHMAGPLMVLLALLSFLPLPGNLFWGIAALVSETITGKTPTFEKVSGIQRFGLYLVMGMIVLIVFSDVFRLFKSI